MSRYRELLAKRDELQKQIEAVREEAAQTCRELIEAFALTAHDVGLVKTQQVPAVKPKKAERTFPAQRKRGPQPPLYRDPASGATWSGRGKEPGWLTGHRDEYLIKAKKP